MASSADTDSSRPRRRAARDGRTGRRRVRRRHHLPARPASLGPAIRRGGLSSSHGVSRDAGRPRASGVAHRTAALAIGARQRHAADRRARLGAGVARARLATRDMAQWDESPLGGSLRGRARHARARLARTTTGPRGVAPLRTRSGGDAAPEIFFINLLATTSVKHLVRLAKMRRVVGSSSNGFIRGASLPASGMVANSTKFTVMTPSGGGDRIRKWVIAPTRSRRDAPGPRPCPPRAAGGVPSRMTQLAGACFASSGPTPARIWRSARRRRFANVNVDIRRPSSTGDACYSSLHSLRLEALEIVDHVRISDSIRSLSARSTRNSVYAESSRNSRQRHRNVDNNFLLPERERELVQTGFEEWNIAERDRK